MLQVVVLITVIWIYMNFHDEFCYLIKMFSILKRSFHEKPIGKIIKLHFVKVKDLAQRNNLFLFYYNYFLLL